MTMTPEQIVIFADHIENNTDPDVVAYLAAGNNGGIRAWYNTTASPDFWVFEPTGIGVDDAYTNYVPSGDGGDETGIDWETDFDTLDQKDLEALGQLFRNGTFDVQRPGGRELLDKIFAGANASKLGLLKLGTRLATRAEVVFAEETTGPGGGNGSTRTASAIAVFWGEATLQDVRDAVALIGS